MTLSMLEQPKESGNDFIYKHFIFVTMSAAAKREEEQFLQLLQSIKEDTEYIKLRLSIENVSLEDLSKEEKSDLDEAIKDLENGKAVKLDEL